MKNTTRLQTLTASHLAILLAVTIMLPGCATMSNPFKQDSAEETTAKTALDAGIALYENGDYAAAAKKLGTTDEIWKANKDVQLKALKYMAFSYCVTSQSVQCKQQFDKALKLDPTFDLEPGEKGHPLWSPVFERAKKQK